MVNISMRVTLPNSVQSAWTADFKLMMSPQPAKDFNQSGDILTTLAQSAGLP
jgi:hypothetical protein